MKVCILDVLSGRWLGWPSTGPNTFDLCNSISIIGQYEPGQFKSYDRVVREVPFQVVAYTYAKRLDAERKDLEQRTKDLESWTAEE